ncbi:hypothetical protein M513_08467 [Trichuris suis]|uniref:Uncharacterized protein n=1 Tax=Trichuris suis TaxID=68888 RepID=A0A085M0B4_9BILA|nr:hypothetical protein M513_08467 [Trichuris suis]
MTVTGKIIRLAAAANEYLRDELGKLDEWPQINGNEPMEMDQQELKGGKLTKSNRLSTARNDSESRPG